MTTDVVAVCAGIALVAGLLLAVAGGRRTTTPPGTSAPVRTTRRVLDLARADHSHARWAVWRWPTALAAGMFAWLVTGWPVSAAITAVTVVGLPILLSTGAQAARAIDRVEAVEEWTRRLSDVLVVGVGLEQAIATTARTCPEPIRTEVAGLVARLDAHWPTESALRAFADDLDDATGDLIAATLILGSRRRGPGLPRVLAAVADSVADEVATRRKIEAERAKPRATARAVTLITLAVVAVGALNGTYLRPYGDPLGQLVLTGIAAGFVAALVWLRALTITPPAPRILTSRRAHSVSGSEVRR
jgi:tight adherence protein B